MANHSIIHDANGIKVRHQGLPPVPIIGSLVMIVVLLFSGIYLTLVIQELAAKLPADWYLKFGWLWRVAACMAIMTGPLFLILYMAFRFCFSGEAQLKCAEWDLSNQQFTATYSGWLRRKRFLGRRLDEIESIQAYAGAEGEGPIEVHLTVSCEERSDVAMDLAMDEVDRRDEVLDVLFSMARLSGLTHYRLDEHDVESMFVSLSRDADVEGSLPIPTPTQAPRYDLDRVSTAVSAPKPKVAPFHPDSFQHPNTRITKWSPGREIRIFHAAASVVAASLMGIMVACIASFLAYGFLTELDPSNPRGLWTLLVAVIAFFAGAIAFRILRHEYEVVLDWDSGAASCRRGWFTRRESLQSIDHLKLQGIEKRRHPKNRPSYSTYLCRLEMILKGGKRIFVVDNGSWAGNDTHQRKQLEPLAAALADSMNKPWRWVSFQEPVATRVFNNVIIGGVLLGIIGLLSFFAYGVWLQSRLNAEYAEIARQVEATGARVVRTGIDVGDNNVFGDGFMVTISDPEFDDDDLEPLLKLFDRFPLYGLDLSGTRISNGAIKRFIGRSSMFMLIARRTSLTADAAPTLAKTNIQCLDVRETAIQLEDVQHWRKYYALDVLYISDEEITEEDLQHLGQVPYLDYVLVNDAETTEQLLTGLNQNVTGANTMTELEKLRYVEAMSLKVAPPPNFYQD